MFAHINEKFAAIMTTYYREYKFTKQQKNLLRDLIVYLISEYDSKIKAGATSPYIARRATAVDFLYEIDKNILGGDDSVMIMMDDVKKLCTPVSGGIRKDYERCSLMLTSGLAGILHLYTNEVIQGLKSELTNSNSNITMASSSSFLF